MMRKVRKIHQAVNAPMGNLITYRAMPTSSIEHIDPFLFLNHHGPQDFKPDNEGLPFGPHPHRGFETLTLIYEGDVTHKDSSGGKDTIKKGGIQWMTAGSGLIHSEVSSEKFKKEGGTEEIIQLWLNLPAKYKMTEPRYTGKQKEEIPMVEEDGVQIRVVSGSWNGARGAVDPLTDIAIFNIRMKEGSALKTTVRPEKNILFYVVSGEVEVNGANAVARQLAEFDEEDGEGGEVRVKALQESRIILGHGTPFNEPIVASGPFVMNTEQQIRAAIRDYQTGRMG